jgi:hypothetical protein
VAIIVHAVQIEGAVRQDDTLGFTGRATGVEDLRGAVLVHRRIRPHRRRRPEQRFVLLRFGRRGAVGLEHDIGVHHLQAVAHRFDQWGEVLVEEQRAAPSVVQDVGDLLRVQPDVDRVEHSPCL